MITEWIALSSELLPFHLSVVHSRKNDESNLPTEYGFQFFLCCSCWCERRLIEFDGTVSDKIAGSTNCHLETIFFVCSPNFIHIQYSCIMRFIVRHNRYSQSVPFFICRKIVAILWKIRVRGTLRDAYTIHKESHYAGVLDNPSSTIIFTGLTKASLDWYSRYLYNNEITQLPENVFSGLRNLGTL